MNSPDKESADRLFFAFTVFTAVVYLSALARPPAFLTGTAEYQWPVLRHGRADRLPAAVLILFAAGGMGLLVVREAGRLVSSAGGRFRVYSSLFLLGFAFQLGPSALHRMGLLELPLRVYLADHTSYFTDAARIEDPRLWVSTFPLRLPELATHSRTHPPLAVLFFYAVQKAMSAWPGAGEAYVRLVPRSAEAMAGFGLTPAQLAAGGVCALLLLFAAAAVVPLTFSLGRMMMSDNTAALAALVFAAAPAFGHKTPVLDHALGLLVLSALWLCLSSVRERKIGRIIAAGAVIGAGLWFGTTLLAAFPLCMLVLAAAGYHFRQDEAPLKRIIIMVSLLAGLLLAVALITTLVIGLFLELDFREVYSAITDLGWRLNNALSGRRRPWLWMAFNPYELLTWAGIPLSAFFLREAVQAGRAVLSRRFPINPWFPPVFLFLAALDLSGKVCYEAARLAWFCFPLLALAAAPSLPLPGPGRAMFRPALVLGLQIASTLVFRMIF